MDYITIIGVVGATMILLAFMMIQLKKWKDDYLVYDGFNLSGSLLLVYYALALKSYPFLVLNGVWAGISLKDVISDIASKNSGKSKSQKKKSKKIVKQKKAKLMHKTGK